MFKISPQSRKTEQEKDYSNSSMPFLFDSCFNTILKFTKDIEEGTDSYLENGKHL